MRYLAWALLVLAGVVRADAPQTRSEYMQVCKLNSELAELIVEARYLGRSMADAALSVDGDIYIETIIEIAYSLPYVRDQEDQTEQRRKLADMVFSSCRKNIPEDIPVK